MADTFVWVNYTEEVLNEEGRREKALFQVEGKVLLLEDCMEVLNESAARTLVEEQQKYESETNPRYIAELQSIQQLRAQNPMQPLPVVGRTPFDTLKRAINNLVQTFRLALVEVEPGVSFWYLFKHCDSEHLHKIYIKYEISLTEGQTLSMATRAFSEEGRFVLRNIPKKINGQWDPEDIEFHKNCTLMNDAIPGILNTLSNWILYGMAATALRDFSIIENLLSSPYVNRTDLLEPLYSQYDATLYNLNAIAAPLGEELRVYRGASEYNTLVGNFNTDTLVATTNNPVTPFFFVNSYNKMKQFVIPADYPVVDLRPFNPQESEILLLPPLSFQLLQQRKENPESVNNINIYSIISPPTQNTNSQQSQSFEGSNGKLYWYAEGEGGYRKTRKQKKNRRKTKRSKPSKR
jgi:hypothetical protein